MSELESKLEFTPSDGGNRARAFLQKHLTYRDGTPRYSVIRADSAAPVIIQTKTMDGKLHLWRRVYFDKKDILFEAVFDGEDHEAYYAAPKQEAAPKKRAARKPSTGTKARKPKKTA